MGNLERLIDICSGSVFVNINENRNQYMRVKEYLRSLKQREQVLEIPDGVEDEMVRLNKVVHVRCYIYTHKPHIDAYHYDLGVAIGMALEMAEEQSLDS